MKVIKRLLSLALILALFTSGSYKLLSGGIDFLKNTYSSVETLVLEINQVTEIEYEEFYEITPQFNSCYKSLNSNQQEIYKALYTISQKMPNGFVKLHKKYDNISRDISIAYNALLYDRTEIFWMPYTYILSEYNDGNDDYSVIAFNHQGESSNTKYNVTLEERDKMIAKFDVEVIKILNKVKGIKSSYDLEIFFNDYICENTEYVSNGDLVGTAYGALVNKKAHCEGYSRAFKYLCNQVDIECDLVCGVSFDEGHMWNVVNIDGIHSYVDVTWNDRTDYKSYLYFNVNEEQMSQDHILSPLHTELDDEEIENGSFNFFKRSVTYKGNTYYERTGSVLPLSYEKKAADTIRREFKKGNNYAEMMFTSKNTLSKFRKGEIKFISAIQKELPNITIKSYIFERDVLVLFFEKGITD